MPKVAGLDEQKHSQQDGDRHNTTAPTTTIIVTVITIVDKLGGVGIPLAYGGDNDRYKDNARG